MASQVDWDLENTVLATVEKEYLIHRTETQLGWVALPNSDFEIGPKWLISFNRPLDVDEIDYISQFAGTADIDTVRRFYRACNGMHIFDGFSVPGVRTAPRNLAPNDSFNIPVSIEVMGDW